MMWKKRENIQLIARRFEPFQSIKVPNRWYFIAQMFFLVPTNPLKDRSFSLNYFCQCFCFVPTFCLFDRCFNIRPFEIMQLHISIIHANCRLISQGNLELSILSSVITLIGHRKEFQIWRSERRLIWAGMIMFTARKTAVGNTVEDVFSGHSV